MVECLNRGNAFDPTHYRWRCPAYVMKDTRYEGKLVHRQRPPRQAPPPVASWPCRIPA